MQLYSTADAEWRDKAQYWADLYRQLSFPIDLRPQDRTSFAANLMLGSLGPLGIGEFRSEPSRVFRNELEIRETGERAFFLHFTLGGQSQIVHCGHRVELAPGDFVLTDSHAPSEVAVAGPHQQLSLRMTRELLTAYIPYPEQLCGIRIDGSRGVARLLANLLPGIWGQVREGLRPEVHDLLVDTVLSTLAASYAEAAGANGRAGDGRHRRAGQIRRYIDDNLRDVELGPAMIASANGVSRRYVHRLFEQEGETLSQYVLRRRLDECASRLRSPLWQTMTITEVAFAFGFSNLSHFCRSFKRRFGKSPSRYRESG